MKISPKTLAKIIGLGAGALVGGPLFAGIGATCGGFIGELFGSEDEGGWDLGPNFNSICCSLLANKVQPFFDEADSGFNQDLRRAAALALVQALEWKKTPGPLAAALLKTNGFAGLSAQSRELLKRLIKGWQGHIQAALNEAEKKGDARLLDALLPPGDDDDLTALADGKLSAEQRTAAAWTLFYQQTLQPVLDNWENKDELKQHDLPTLQSCTIECLASVFPAAFSRVVKSSAHQPAWIAYQKALLTATQRAVHELGDKSGTHLTAIEGKMDVLINQDAARASLHQNLTSFLSKVETKIDGTYENTQAIKGLITKCRTSLESKLDKVQDSIDVVNQKLNELLHRKPLNQYYKNLTRRFSSHHSLGIPAVEDTRQKQGPDLIDQLFVQPTYTTERLRPEDLPTALEDQARKPELLLPRLARERRVVLLADPGMGKSTLIQWLIVALAEPVPSPAAAAFGRAIPLPFILRDLVPLLPADLNDWTWKALVDAFLKHRHDKDQPGVARPLADDEDTLREVLSSPQAWFLIDGLDEVGDKHRREALRDVIWQGFQAHPEARFLITSRVVGYDEAMLDRELKVLGADWKITQVGRDRKAELLREKSIPSEELESLDLELEGQQSFFSELIHAKLFYLAPWDDSQQLDFAKHWFGLRLGSGHGPQRAREFVQAVHDHSSTSSIGRVPNLLLLMALLYRYRADLPHGRAKVYAAISQAYLENIAKVCRIDHRTQTSVPYTLLQKERLLAIIAMHMQVRRTAEASQKKKREVDSEILASRKDLESWLCAEFGKKTDHENTAEMEKFIAHIADTSGLLLPRGVVNGEEQFAFAHLSFQEYYTACWLELEFSRLLNLDEDEDDFLGYGIPEPKAPLAMTKELFAQRAALTSWREPLLFLAEKLAERPADTLTLRKWLFPIRKGDAKPLPIRAQQLLATFSVDPQVSLTLEQRQPIWDYLCRAHLNNQDLWRESVLPSLLIASEYHSTIFSRLVDLADELKVVKLSFNDCMGLSELSGLHGLNSLKSLSLIRCPKVNDLSGLQRLSDLNILFLSDCLGVSNLSGLHGLNKLQILDVLDCPSLSGLSGLQGLENLRSIDFSGCTGVIDLGVLKGMSLQSLNLSGCMGVIDLSVLNGMSSLQSLDISGCTGVVDLSALKGMSNLQILNLKHCIGVIDFGVLKGMSNLQNLDLSGCLGFSDLRMIKGLNKLQNVSLSNYSKIIDLGVFKEMSDLKELDLSYCPGVIDMGVLKRMSKLQKLNLSGCAGVIDLDKLKGVSSLQNISLSGCPGVIDLDVLKGMSNLRILFISGCTGILDLERQVTDLKKALPDLKIFV